MGKPSCGDPPVSSNSDPVFLLLFLRSWFVIVGCINFVIHCIVSERREVLVVVLAKKEKRLHNITYEVSTFLTSR